MASSENIRITSRVNVISRFVSLDVVLFGLLTRFLSMCWRLVSHYLRAHSLKGVRVGPLSVATVVACSTYLHI